MNITVNSEQLNLLTKEHAKMLEVLESVVNSCAHPDIAIRCVMVDLTEIRKAIKRNKEINFSHIK